MAHQRKLIRDAVLAALVDATDAEARVFNNRIAAWPVRILQDGPAISVYAVSEEVDPGGARNSSPKKLNRVLQLGIEGVAVASGSGDVEDTLDELALQIERAMHRDQTFGDTCGTSTLVDTHLEVAENGETEIGNIRLLYEVEYFTHAPERADVELDDLLLMRGNTNLENAQAVLDQQQFEAVLDGGPFPPDPTPEPAALIPESFACYDRITGLPKDDADPQWLDLGSGPIYLAKIGSPRTPVAFENRGDGGFVFYPTTEDRAAGVVGIIDCGVDCFPRYQVVTIHGDANAFATFVPFSLLGELSAGACTVYSWRSLVDGAPLTPVAEPVQVGAYEIYTVTPSAPHRALGVQFKLLSPSAGIQPRFTDATFTAVDVP